MRAILQHELNYYFKNTKELIQVYGLFISVVLIAPFGLHGGGADIQILSGAILWIALITSISLGASNLYTRDAESGRLEYYPLLRVSLEGVVLAKWLAFFLFIAIPLLTIFPVTALLLSIPEHTWLRLAVGLLAGASALTLLSSLAAVLMAGLEKAGAVLALVILPLSIPVMIFGTSYAAETCHIFSSSLIFLLSFSGFLLPILVIAGASCIRSSQ